MNCTDDMYQAFKDVAFGPSSDNETQADCFMNGIEAAMACKAKSVVWPKAVGRVLEDGPKTTHPYGALCLRSYSEYSKADVSNSIGYSKEGEEVFTRSQVEQMLR